MEKYSIEQKLEVLDELIRKFRDCTSLWSIKKQLTAIKAEKKEKKSEAKVYVTFGNYYAACVRLPEYNKICKVQTTKGECKAVYTLGKNGGEWHRLDTEEIIIEPVLRWAYIKHIIVA